MSSGDTAESLASTGVPVIILILVGFLFDRIHAFPTNKALPWINKFVFYLGIPALVFKALAVCDFINSQSFNWNFVLAFLVWRAIIGVFAFLVSLIEWKVDKVRNQQRQSLEIELDDSISTRNEEAEDNSVSRDFEFEPHSYKDWIGRGITFWISESFVNTLIFGIPMIEAIYGPASIIYNVYAALSSLLFQLPILLCLFEYRKEFLVTSNPVESTTSRQKIWNALKFILKTIFLNPPFIGIVLGLCYSLIFTSNISGAVSNGEIYPPALNNLVVWLGQTVTPLASFAIGLFASREFKYFFKLKVLLRDILLLLILLKFILVPMLAIGFLYAFGINGTEGRIGVLIASLPVALAGFILCENYHVGNHIIAAQVVWGTVLMLPVIIIWDQIMQAMNMFG